ncbi:MAG: PAS-domain containing protein [Pseudomonadota bacterium]
MTFVDGLTVISVALLTARLAFYVLHMKSPAAPSWALEDGDEPVAFLFDNGVLHHATDRALARFTFFPGANVWDDLREALLPRFPDFPEMPAQDAPGELTVVPFDVEDTAVIRVNWKDGLSWVEMETVQALSETQVMSPHREAALQLCAQTMPSPAWEEMENGKTGWRNAAFEALARQHRLDPDASPFPLSDHERSTRLSLTQDDGTVEWYEIKSTRNGSRTLHHALPITNLVKAEEAQGMFVQTLSKTFAHLSIGLAIFDGDGKLSIFNPALVDLTGLDPSFLATRPPMISFFDQMRENRAMPEPKNYATWRQNIAEMIAQATGGDYRETWTLEDGRTHAVQGRPHPEGLTVFMIEDISSEVTLSRSFRREISIYESTLDTFEDGVAVFLSSGVLSCCNRAYRALWNHNPEDAFAEVYLRDALSVWRGATTPDTDWAMVERDVLAPTRKDASAVILSMRDGTKVECRSSPIGAGAIVVRFQERRRHPLKKRMAESC